MYRTGSPAPVRTIDIRPDGPGLTGRSLVQGGTALTAFGLLSIAVLVVIPTGGGAFASDVVWFWIMAILCAVGGAFMLWFGAFRFVTFVRVSASGDEVSFDWRGRAGIVRSERVRLSDVVEVVLTDAPDSGVRSYGLAVGMKNGQIALNSMVVATNVPAKVAHFQTECRRLAEFLAVPARNEST